MDMSTQPQGPRMIQEPQGVVVFCENTSSLFLECVAHALPSPQIGWYRGSQRIEQVTSGNDTRYTLTSGRLTIQHPNQKSDAGDYSCAATNDIGTVLSSPAKIIFGYLNTFSDARPKDVVGTAYEGVRVNCMEPPNYPAVKFSWFIFHTNNYIYPGHPYHFVSQSGMLYFSELRPTDDKKYYCVVTLAAPDYMRPANKFPPSRVSLGTYLVIRPGVTHNSYGPVLFTHVFPVPALRGSIIRLECVAFGALPLAYSWKREDGRPFTNGTKMLNRNRVLQIPNAIIESEGNYICTCTRRTTSKSATIVLAIETKPYFPYPIGDMFVDPGQKVVWRCKAVARPNATYSWFKDGQLLQEVPGKMEVQVNELVIHNVDAGSDEGMYQCGATNQHGTSYNTGRLKVLSPLATSTATPSTPSTTASTATTEVPVIEYNWNLTSIRKPGETTGYKYTVTVHGGAAVKDGGIEISSSSQYIDFGTTNVECLINPSTCTNGLTLRFKIKFNKLEENTYLMTSGGERPDGIGLAMVYVYGRIQFVLSTNNTLWFASCGRESVYGNGYHIIMISWYKTSGLYVYVDNRLVASAVKSIQHNGTTATGTHAYFGKSLVSTTVQVHYTVQTLIVWHARLEILIHKGICKPPITAPECIGKQIPQSQDSDDMDGTRVIILAVVCAVLGALLVIGAIYIIRLRCGKGKTKMEAGRYETTHIHGDRTQKSSQHDSDRLHVKQKDNPAYSDL